MNKKIISLWILLLSFFSIWFWYSLVFAWNSTNIDFVSSNNIFLDSLTLNKTRVIIRSRENIEDIKVSWDCSVSSRFINKNTNIYAFDLSFLDKNCNLNSINVLFQKWDINLNLNLNIYSRLRLYNDFLDFSDDRISRQVLDLQKWINILSKDYKTYNPWINKNVYDFTRSNRRLLELEYMNHFLEDILNKRLEKYSIPVKNGEMTTVASKLPNAWRPYRADYTDWIHEWWDFDTKFWDKVYSLDHWVVIRIVDNFKWEDFNRIVRWNSLSELQKMRNLDILRWNQVWIKTMKWDVAFYSHLDEVFSNLSVWDIVIKWQPLWTVGISWVPDKSYNDYHLHLELRKNPYENKKINYSFDDYMSWDWYFKWKNRDYIINNQNNIFE